jgi:hypothetical protein
MVRWEKDHPGGNLGIRGDRPPWLNAAAYLRVPARKRERESARDREREREGQREKVRAKETRQVCVRERDRASVCGRERAALRSRMPQQTCLCLVVVEGSETEKVASATLGQSQDVCKGARSFVEGKRCVRSG